MFNRIKHTSQGFLAGSLLTASLCAGLYVHTHDIKFTATASNQPKEIISAEANAVSMASLMPAETKSKVVKAGFVPERKPQ